MSNIQMFHWTIFQVVAGFIAGTIFIGDWSAQFSLKWWFYRQEESLAVVSLYFTAVIQIYLEETSLFALSTFSQKEELVHMNMSCSILLSQGPVCDHSQERRDSVLLLQHLLSPLQRQ